MDERTKAQLVSWLDDLSVRFLLNLPASELSSVPRLCFQVEEAQWFYEDFIRPAAAVSGSPLPSLQLRQFCLLLFQHCPLLSGFSDSQHLAAYEEFLAYKVRVPVRGAILMDDSMEKLVLVKGWKKNASWSFPRGKINKDEKDLDCAIREVYEETGYNIREAGLVPDDESQVKHIEIVMREQHMKLFVFRGIPENTYFEPRTRKEISKIAWYNVRDLPGFKKQNRGADGVAAANKFYMVAPFLGPLKKWINQQKKQDALDASQSYAQAITEDEGLMTDDFANASRGTEPIDRLKNMLSLGGGSVVPTQEWSNTNSQPDLLTLIRGGSIPIVPPPQEAIGQVQSAPQALQPQIHHNYPYPGVQHSSSLAFASQPSIPHAQSHEVQQGAIFGTSRVPYQHPEHQNMYPSVMNDPHAPHNLQNKPAGLAMPESFPQRQWAQHVPQEYMAQGPQGPIGAGPDVPRAENLPRPNLSTHSLNLLSAFKSVDKQAPSSGSKDAQRAPQSNTHQSTLLELFKRPIIPVAPIEMAQPTPPEAVSPTLTEVTVRPQKSERKTTLNEITRTLPKSAARMASDPSRSKPPTSAPTAPKATQAKMQKAGAEATGPNPFQPKKLPMPKPERPRGSNGSRAVGPTEARKSALQPAAVVTAERMSHSQTRKHDSINRRSPGPKPTDAAQSIPQYTILARPNSAKASPTLSGSNGSFQPQILGKSPAGSPSPSVEVPLSDTEKSAKVNHLLALISKDSLGAAPPIKESTNVADASKQPIESTKPPRPELLGLFTGSSPLPTLRKEQTAENTPIPRIETRSSQPPANAPLLDLFIKPNMGPVMSPGDAVSPFVLGTPATRTMPSMLQHNMLPIGHSRPSALGQGFSTPERTPNERTRLNSVASGVSSLGERTRLNSMASGVSTLGSGQATPTETKGFLLDYLNGVVQQEANRSKR